MKKILIIDDDTIVSHIYHSSFRMEGYESECATDGQAGLDKMDTFQPDLVLLDLALPSVNGIQVLSRIRARPETRDLPVIVLTNCYQPKLVEEAWKVGATKCLRKSECTPRAVSEVVATLLASAPPSQPAKPDPAQPDPAIPQSLEDLRGSFFSQAHTTVANLRQLFQNATKEEDPDQRTAILAELRQAIPSLAGTAAVCGYAEIAQFASAIEALVQELRDRPKYVTPSTVHTLAQAIDFLGDFIGHWLSNPTVKPDLPPNILVVDDDITSREMVTFALEKAGLNSISLESPQTALDVLACNRFDLIFLDVNMPEMNGFDLCARIRQQPKNDTCPIVFVTAASDFTNRARSTISGGTDLIGKPFLLVELAVKALIHLFGQKLKTSNTSFRKAA